MNFPYLPSSSRRRVRKSLMQERDVSHDSLIVRLWNTHILWVHYPNNVQFFLRHFEGPLQILQWIFWVTVLVVEQVRTVPVYDRTEGCAISPAAMEVGHIHFLIAGQEGKGGGKREVKGRKDGEIWETDEIKKEK